MGQVYESKRPTKEERESAKFHNVQVGDLVILSSAVRHFSTPNLSSSIRRAFMPQFSISPIVASKLSPSNMDCVKEAEKRERGERKGEMSDKLASGIPFMFAIPVSTTSSSPPSTQDPISGTGSLKRIRLSDEASSY